MCLAVPGRVETVYEADGVRMGKLTFGGVVKDVCLAYLPEVAVGEYAVVHAGFAIGKIDAATAAETLRAFADMGVPADERGEASG